MISPIYQHRKGDMLGNLYKVNDTYYYKIYYKINNKYKLISQSYVNLFDKELCLERLFHDMDIIDTSKAKRLK